MKALVAYPFVRERANGGYSVHDSMRDPLLDWWTRNPSVGVNLAESSDRLLDVYRATYKEARRGAEHLSAVASLVRSTNAERYLELREAIDDISTRSAIDIIHLALRIGQDRGLTAFTQIFFDLESEQALDLCGVITAAFAEQSEFPTSDIGEGLGDGPPTTPRGWLQIGGTSRALLRFSTPWRTARS